MGCVWELTLVCIGLGVIVLCTNTQKMTWYNPFVNIIAGGVVIIGVCFIILMALYFNAKKHGKNTGPKDLY